MGRPRRRGGSDNLVECHRVLTAKSGNIIAHIGRLLVAFIGERFCGDQTGVPYVNVESSFMASHSLNHSDRRMFCQLVENYTKDVALILQERMGQAAATAHVIDNMAVVIDLLFDETPPDEVAFALHTAITETAH